MRTGYARGSTKDQAIDLQVDVLTQAGCPEVDTD
jgi:hypothetical protein